MENENPIRVIRATPEMGIGRRSWMRIMTVRQDGRVGINDISTELADRVLPKLCDRIGVPRGDRGGLFRGEPKIGNPGSLITTAEPTC